jgi:hypothetical protein
LLIGQYGLSKDSFAYLVGVDPSAVYDDIQRIANSESIIKGQLGGASNNLITFEQD